PVGAVRPGVGDRSRPPRVRPGAGGGVMTAGTTTATDLAAYFAPPLAELRRDPETPERVNELLDALEAGTVRAAEPDTSGWRVNTWVKHGILAAFALSETVELPGWPGGAVDKSLVPPRQVDLRDGIRLVPGGTSVRRGAHLAEGVVVMPPSYVNTGASVGAGSMVDSHVLVGSDRKSTRLNSSH